MGTKILIQRMHSLTMNQDCIYLNGGGNVYTLKMEESGNIQSALISRLTHSTGKTFQLQLEYPFIIQRSQK